jgi:hypothetical protein
MKIAASMLRNNPVHALLALGGIGLTGAEIPGSPLLDNAGTIMMDPLRMSYALGVDQAFNAYALNPWVNAGEAIF